MSTPTHCLECGEELWTPAEAGGFCVGCQRREREESLDSYERDLDDEDAAERARERERDEAYDGSDR